MLLVEVLLLFVLLLESTELSLKVVWSREEGTCPFSCLHFHFFFFSLGLYLPALRGSRLHCHITLEWLPLQFLNLGLEAKFLVEPPLHMAIVLHDLSVHLLLHLS